MNYWQAALYSTKAGVFKKVFGRCLHKHRSFASADNCVKRLSKTNKDSRKIWRTAEIAMRMVRR